MRIQKSIIAAWFLVMLMIAHDQTNGGNAPTCIPLAGLLASRSFSFFRPKASSLVMGEGAFPAFDGSIKRDHCLRSERRRCRKFHDFIQSCA